jgi:hypothetical protein
MRILLYEFISAGGWRSAGWNPPAESLQREGAAMLAAVAADFRQIDGVEVLIADSSAATRATQDAIDWTLVIAPETAGVLLDLVRQVESVGGRLLGPSSEFVRLTGDKQSTAEQLALAGIRVPTGVRLTSGAPLPRNFPYPAVLKPSDGAGSQATLLVESADADVAVIAPEQSAQPWRLERYCPGSAASVALLCGSLQPLALPPCSQRLSSDGRFQYLGGRTPLPPALAQRAVDLAERALAALPPALGYVGFDLVLGESADGRDDYVIEVNPRLTTSYVGLRALCRDNLAQGMLDTADGRIPALSWQPGPVEFDSDGQVRRTN